MTSLLEKRIDEETLGVETSRQSNVAARFGTPKDNQKSTEPQHKEPKHTPEETHDPDPEDSALYQRSRPKPMGTDGAKEGYITEFHNQKQLDIPRLFSYVGSGVREQQGTIEQGDRQQFEHLNSPPTPEQGGKLIAGILSEAVAKTNEHIPPETKERFLIWLQLPEGRVWLHHYENTSTVRTRDYNFGSLN